MATHPRYAIYYAAAPDTDLDRFGARLLGYDALSGKDLPFPDGVLQMAPDWRELTRDPRKYGFHATLKAPFPLRDGASRPRRSFQADLFSSSSWLTRSRSQVVGAVEAGPGRAGRLGGISRAGGGMVRPGGVPRPLGVPRLGGRGGV